MTTPPAPPCGAPASTYSQTPTLTPGTAPSHVPPLLNTSPPPSSPPHQASVLTTHEAERPPYLANPPPSVAISPHSRPDIPTPLATTGSSSGDQNGCLSALSSLCSTLLCCSFWKMCYRLCCTSSVKVAPAPSPQKPSQEQSSNSPISASELPKRPAAREALCEKHIPPDLWTWFKHVMDAQNDCAQLQVMVDDGMAGRSVLWQFEGIQGIKLSFRYDPVGDALEVRYNEFTCVFKDRQNITLNPQQPLGNPHKSDIS